MTKEWSRPEEEDLGNEVGAHVLRVRLEDSIFASRFLSVIEDMYMGENGQDSIPRISEKIIRANVLGRPSRWIDLELTDADMDHLEGIMEQGKMNSKLSAKGKQRVIVGEERIIRMFEGGLRREDIRNVKSKTARFTRTIINSLRPKLRGDKW